MTNNRSPFGCENQLEVVDWCRSCYHMIIYQSLKYPSDSMLRVSTKSGKKL